jgi:hypothetical protein
MTSLLCTILAPLAYVAAVLLGSAVFHVASGRQHDMPPDSSLPQRSITLAAERCPQHGRLTRSVDAARDAAHWN